VTTERVSVAAFADAWPIALELVARRIERGIAARGRAAIVLSGGRSPRTLYERLGAMPLAWSKVTVTLSDERWLPIDHCDSNEGLVRRTLMASGRPANAATMVGLKTAHATPQEGAAEVAARLEAIPHPYDAAILGMGEDGHVASLFPGGAWRCAQGRCVATAAPPPPHARVSMTPAELRACRAIVLLVGGAAKRATLARAMNGAADLPVGLLFASNLPVLVIEAATAN
jgi:6-phosphogluconolactonase